VCVGESQSEREFACVVRKGERERESMCVCVSVPWRDDGAASCNTWALAVSACERETDRQSESVCC